MTKKFTLLQLFSVLDGRLSTNMGDVYDIFNHICDTDLMTHHLPVAFNYLKEKNPKWFNDQQNKLNSIKARLNSNTFKTVIGAIKDKYNEEIEISQLKDEFDTSDFEDYIINAPNQFLTKVEEFHKVFGHPIAEAPFILTKERAKLKHGERYDYSLVNYFSTKTKVLILCHKHGEFHQKPASHLQGKGCPKCGKELRSFHISNTTESFIQKGREAHNNFYSYENTIYKSYDDKIIITCPIHGDFAQRANSHLQGNGCKKCSNLNSVGFTKSRFCRKYEMASLYIVSMKRESEFFIKIGITGKSLHQRKLDWSGYSVYKFLQIEHDSDKIWDLEKYLHDCLKQHQYAPLIIFNGHTECFLFKTIMDIPSLLLEQTIIPQHNEKKKVDHKATFMENSHQ